MNRSKIDDERVIHSTAIVCPTCRSNEFYRDAQSGIVCIYCGLEMPNFLLESQEEAGHGRDEAEITFGARRLPRTGQKVKALRSTFRTSLSELFSIYQYCLILFVKELARLLSVNNTDQTELEHDMIITAKRLWSMYLQRWQKCPTACKIEGIFCKKFYNKTDNRFCVCEDPFFSENHPAFPTKPLLLGFLDLIVRIHRLSCVPADIVRFCDRGLLPFHNLWEALPESIRQPIEHSHYTRFFTLKHAGRLTPMNIWYHTTILAASLHVDIPPLNVPAVALSFIHGLGLPEDEVWPTYVQIAHLFEEDQGVAPLRGLQTDDIHHVEHIMIMVLFACLLCTTWSEWSLSTYTALDEFSVASLLHTSITDDDNIIEAIPNVTDMTDLDLELSRKLLPHICIQSRKVLSDVLRRHFQASKSTSSSSSSPSTSTLRPINRVILHLLDQLQVSIMHHEEGHQSKGNLTEKISQLFPQHAEIPTKSSDFPNYFSESIPPEPITYSHQLLFHAWLSKEDRAYLRVLDGRPTQRIGHARAKDGHNPIRHYTSYARHTEDSTGRRPLSYTLLLERAAKYLYIPPLLLQQGLDAIDRQVAHLIIEEQEKIVLQPMSDTADGAAHDPHLWQRIAGMANARYARQYLHSKIQNIRNKEEQEIIERAARHQSEGANPSRTMEQLEAEEVKKFARYRDKTAKWLPMLHAMYLSGEIDRTFGLASSPPEKSETTKAEGLASSTAHVNRGLSLSDDEDEDDDEEQTSEQDSSSSDRASSVNDIAGLDDADLDEEY